MELSSPFRGCQLATAAPRIVPRHPSAGCIVTGTPSERQCRGQRGRARAALGRHPTLAYTGPQQGPCGRSHAVLRSASLPRGSGNTLGNSSWSQGQELRVQASLGPLRSQNGSQGGVEERGPFPGCHVSSLLGFAAFLGVALPLPLPLPLPQALAPAWQDWAPVQLLSSAYAETSDPSASTLDAVIDAASVPAQAPELADSLSPQGGATEVPSVALTPPDSQPLAAVDAPAAASQPVAAERADPAPPSPVPAAPPTTTAPPLSDTQQRQQQLLLLQQRKQQYDQEKLLEQNRRMQALNGVPQGFPAFVREGFEVRVITGPEYTRAPSGLLFWDIVQGKGSPPSAGQQVQFHYVGYNETGRRIDSTYLQGRPAETRVGINAMIPGFEEGISSMKPGGVRRIVVPPELGPPTGPSTFFSSKQYEVFDIELLEVKDCTRRQVLFYSDVVCE